MRNGEVVAVELSKPKIGSVIKHFRLKSLAGTTKHYGHDFDSFEEVLWSAATAEYEQLANPKLWRLHAKSDGSSFLRKNDFATKDSYNFLHG